jgi:hypothetical protein
MARSEVRAGAGVLVCSKRAVLQQTRVCLQKPDDCVCITHVWCAHVWLALQGGE